MDVYRRIHAEIARMTQFEELAENMTRLVTELYNQIDIGDVERWVFGFNKIEYPSAVSTTVTADLNPAKTYVRADYDALVVLTIALRLSTTTALGHAAKESLGDLLRRDAIDGREHGSSEIPKRVGGRFRA